MSKRKAEAVDGATCIAEKRPRDGDAEALARSAAEEKAIRGVERRVVRIFSWSAEYTRGEHLSHLLAVHDCIWHDDASSADHAAATAAATETVSATVHDLTLVRVCVTIRG
jgi:hypothetical protein